MMLYIRGLVNHLRWLWQLIRFELSKIKKFKIKRSKVTHETATLSFVILSCSSSVIELLKASGFKLKESKNKTITHWSIDAMTCCLVMLTADAVVNINKRFAGQSFKCVLYFIDLQANINNQLVVMLRHVRLLSIKSTPRVVVTTWQSLQSAKLDSFRLINLNQTAIAGDLIHTLLMLCRCQASNWCLIKTYYQMLELKSQLIKQADLNQWMVLYSNTALATSMLGLTEQGSVISVHQLSISEWLLKYSMPSVCVLTLLFSWQVYADYHHYHKVDRQIQHKALHLYPSSAHYTVSQLSIYTKVQSAMHAQLLSVKRFNHLIEKIFKRLLVIEDEQAAIALCYKLHSMQLGQISQWFMPQPIPMVYMKSYRRPYIWPCVKSLLALQPNRVGSKKALLNLIDHYADKRWLRWAKQLRWEPLPLSVLSDHWRTITSPQGMLNRLLQFFIQQQSTSKDLSSFKKRRFVKWHSIKKGQTQQAAYWKTLNSLKSMIQLTQQQQRDLAPHADVVIHVLHDLKLPIRQADEWARQWVTEIKDPDLQVAVLHLLEIPLVALWHSLLHEAQQEINVLWQQRVWNLWYKELSTYFPFAESFEDASFKTIQALLEPQHGTLAQFMHQYVAPMFDQSNHALTFLNETLAWDSKALAAIHVAQQWSEYLFQDEGRLQFKWDFYPLLQANVVMWLLESAKQRMIYHNGPRRWHTFYVPNTNAIADTSLAVMASQTQQASLTLHGAWGLWRLISKAQAISRGNQRYLLIWYFNKAGDDTIAHVTKTRNHPDAIPTKLGNFSVVTPAKAGIHTQLIFNPHTPGHLNLWQTPLFTLPNKLFK